MKIVFTPSKRDVNLKGIFCPECGERLKNVAISEDSKIENLRIRCKRCRLYHKLTVEPEENRHLIRRDDVASPSPRGEGYPSFGRADSSLYTKEPNE